MVCKDDFTSNPNRFEIDASDFHSVSSRVVIVHTSSKKISDSLRIYFPLWEFEKPKRSGNSFGMTSDDNTIEITSVLFDFGMFPSESWGNLKYDLVAVCEHCEIPFIVPNFVDDECLNTKFGCNWKRWEIRSVKNQWLRKERLLCQLLISKSKYNWNPIKIP